MADEAELHTLGLPAKIVFPLTVCRRRRCMEGMTGNTEYSPAFTEGQVCWKLHAGDDSKRMGKSRHTGFMALVTYSI